MSGIIVTSLQSKDENREHVEEIREHPMGMKMKGSEQVNASVNPGGIKAVVSIRMDRQTIEALDEYARSIDEKLSTIARGFIVDGLENAGTRMTSDELHELTKLRMKEELAQTGRKIKKEIRKGALHELQSAQQDLSYWLSRPTEERVAAVDYLRRQHHGSRARLQRVARVVQRA